MIIANNEVASLIGYENEAELQKLIADKPNFLIDEDTSEELLLIKREVELKDTGKIDILMMSPAGIITVVEVKLARNSQSRREVIAQIIDYVSTLSEYSYYELDKATNNALSNVVNNLENSNELPRIIENNIKSGTIRLIIAVDDANDNLRKLTRFMSDHTDFDLNLIEIKKYRNKGTDIYSSCSVIKSSEKSNKNKDNYQSVFILLSQIWTEKHPEMPLNCYKSNFRQIYINENYKEIHYEFNCINDTLQIRLDNELHFKSPLETTISKAIDEFNGFIAGENTFIIRPYYKKKRSGRVLYTEISSSNINLAVSLMEQLIEATHDKIYNLLLQYN